MSTASMPLLLSLRTSYTRSLSLIRMCALPEIRKGWSTRSMRFHKSCLPAYSSVLFWVCPLRDLSSSTYEKGVRAWGCTGVGGGEELHLQLNSLISSHLRSSYPTSSTLHSSPLMAIHLPSSPLCTCSSMATLVMLPPKTKMVKMAMSSVVCMMAS